MQHSKFKYVIRTKIASNDNEKQIKSMHLSNFSNVIIEP